MRSHCVIIIFMFLICSIIMFVFWLLITGQTSRQNRVTHNIRNFTVLPENYPKRPENYPNMTEIMRKLSHQITTIVIPPGLMRVGVIKEISNRRKLRPDLIPFMTNLEPTHHSPWHASIYHQVKKDVRSYKCAGTFINPNVVLTAAHCVSHDDFPMKAKDVSVSLGRLNLNVNETSAQHVEVADIILHPNFTETDDIYDIAVIRLSTKATFNNYVRPIWNSNKTEFSTIEGRQGTVVGWGETETGEASNMLQNASLSVLPLVKCLSSNRFNFGLYISQNNFCAGLENDSSECFGVSGESMTFEENENSQRLCDTMLFTDISEYLQWIEDVAFECEVKVPCDTTYDEEDYFVCKTNYYEKHQEEKCRPIFEEIANVTSLHIYGLKSLIDLSDANIKFKNLKSLHLIYSFGGVHSVERTKLTAFQRIEQLHLAGNDTELGEDTFDDLKNLTDLALYSGINLEELHVDIFSQLRHLNSIFLHNNQIENLPADIFRNNEQLEYIYVGANELEELHSDLFVRVQNLKKLSLLENCIKIVPPNIFRNNGKLEDLNLDSNQIEQIHPDLLAELRNLKFLALNYNQIAILSSNLFRNNKGLQELSVSYNKIEDLLPDLFVTLQNLQKLNFRRNQIEILPMNLFQNNRKLQSVRLGDNKIQEIHPDLFAELRKLTELSLAHNQIETLPPNLFRNNSKLVVIEIVDNRLKELHPDLFKGLHNLERLFFHHNQIEILPQGLFRDNEKLARIILGYNKIKTIAIDFTNLPNLDRIDLSSNICLDESCYEKFCGTTSLIEMGEKFRRNCSST